MEVETRVQEMKKDVLGHKYYELYNQSNNDKFIDIFSKNYDEHTGVIKYYNDDEYFLSDRKEEVSIIDFRFSDIKDFIFKYFLVGDNDNELKKVMFAKYFSPSQYNDEWIRCYAKFNSNGFNLQVPLDRKKTLSVELQSKESAKYYSNKEGCLIDVVPESQFCVIVENTSDVVKSVDLLSLCKGKAEIDKNNPNKGYVRNTYINVDDDKDFYSNGYSIENVISDITDDVKIFNFIKVVTFNPSQVTQIIKHFFPDDEVETPIITQAYFTANQYHSYMIDIPIEYELSNKYSMIVPVLPNTKVMYYFYNDKNKKNDTNEIYTPYNTMRSENLLRRDIKIEEKIDESQKLCYEFDVTNNADVEQEAVLFGYNTFLLTDNFGSDKGISIEIKQPLFTDDVIMYYKEENSQPVYAKDCIKHPFDMAYLSILKNTTENPCFVKDVEIITEVDYGDNKIYFRKRDANGRGINIPIKFSGNKTITPDMVKYGALDVIDGNGWFDIKLKPKQKMTIKINAYKVNFERNNN